MPGILIGNCVIKHNGVITSKPTLASAEITNTDPDEVVITFDQALDAASVPATTAFALVGKTISNVAIVGSTVVLTVTVKYKIYDTVTVDYLKPVADMIKGQAGGLEADSFSGQSVINNIEMIAEIATYTSGLTTPLSEAQIVRLTDFVEAIKSGLSITSLSDAFDVMYILGGETEESSLRNIVKNAHHATPQNSPTFTQYEGFQGNGSSSYIDTNYRPGTQAVKYALDGASVGFYSRINIAAGDKIELSNREGIFMYSKYTGNVAPTRINTNTFDSPANTDARGMFIGVRPNATQQIYYKNKSGTTYSRNSTAIGTNYNIYILSTSVGAYSDNQLSFVFAGKSLDQSEVDVVTDSFEVYMDANGKGVI